MSPNILPETHWKIPSTLKPLLSFYSTVNRDRNDGLKLKNVWWLGYNGPPREACRECPSNIINTLMPLALYNHTATKRWHYNTRLYSTVCQILSLSVFKPARMSGITRLVSKNLITFISLL